MGLMSTAALRQASRTAKRIASFIATALVLMVLSALSLPGVALAESAGQPSVLIVDSNLGDAAAVSATWLGDPAAVEAIAEEGGLVLTTSAAPVWYTPDEGMTAPVTFMLTGSPKAPITSQGIVWALDQIAASGARGKTFIVAIGPSGYPVREYLEDVSSTKQSSRADVVGVAFCGTAHNGYSTMAAYPELGIWNRIASAVGLTQEDIATGSEYLSALNSGRFPNVVKTLVIDGAVGDLGFGACDGAAVKQDFALSTSVAGAFEASSVSANIGQWIELSQEWGRFTNEINTPGRLVDEKLAEVISSYESYGQSRELVTEVADFYKAWFAGVDPVTHLSNVVALDLSGSMNEEIVPGSVKIDVAKGAASEFLQAIDATVGLPYAAPVSVDVIGFAESLSDISSGYSGNARSDLVSKASAVREETNIGIALEDALSKLDNTPAGSDKYILLLSDGAATRGMSNEEMLSGPVARAAQQGITINAIGFGDVGESNAEFLKQAAQATGGNYYQASDTFDLEVDFLRIFYTSLGMELIDQELPSGAVKEYALGTTDATTVAWNIGAIGRGYAPSLSLTCNGEAVDPSLYTISTEGAFTSLQFVNPPAGEYSVKVSGGDDIAHLFAMRQRGIENAMSDAVEQQDNTLLWLLGAGVLGAASIAAAAVFTKKRSRKS